ncbi:MAG: hypothetical protein WAK55_02915, partial [Xanthobacteraceae bacterium]
LALKRFVANGQLCRGALNFPALFFDGHGKLEANRQRAQRRHTDTCEARNFARNSCLVSLAQ